MSITIPLSKPLVGHAGKPPITAFVLREPTGREYFQHGDPASWVRSPDGSNVLVENDAVIEAYLHACLVEPNDPLIVGTVSLRDAIKLKETVLGFFEDARRAQSETPATDSSSTSGSSTPTPAGA